MRAAILALLILTACGSSNANGHDRVYMGTAPEAWHCVEFNGSSQYPGHYHPCFNTDATCIKNRAMAQNNGFQDVGRCERILSAFCHLSDSTARSCHRTLALCEQSRTQSLDREHVVTECQPMPP